MYAVSLIEPIQSVPTNVGGVKIIKEPTQLY